LIEKAGIEGIEVAFIDLAAPVPGVLKDGLQLGLDSRGCCRSCIKQEADPLDAG
jgi:hypothetical protein